MQTELHGLICHRSFKIKVEFPNDNTTDLQLFGNNLTDTVSNGRVAYHLFLNLEIIFSQALLSRG